MSTAPESTGVNSTEGAAAAAVPVVPSVEPEASIVGNERGFSVPADPSRQRKIPADDVISVTDAAAEASRRADASAGGHLPLENDIGDEDKEDSSIFSSPCPPPSPPSLSMEHPAADSTEEIQPAKTTTVLTMPGIEGELEGGHHRELSDVSVSGGVQGAEAVTTPLAPLPEDVPVEIEVEIEEVSVPAEVTVLGGGETVPAAVDVDGNIKGEEIGGVFASYSAESVHAPNSPGQLLSPSSEVSIDAESFRTDSGTPGEAGDKGSGAIGIGIGEEGGSEFGIESYGTRGVSSDGDVSPQPSRSPHRPPLTDATSLLDVAALVDAEGMAAEQEFLEALQAVGSGEDAQVVAEGAAGELGLGAHVEAGDREEDLDVSGTGGGAISGAVNAATAAETAAMATGSGDTFSVLDGGDYFDEGACSAPAADEFVLFRQLQEPHMVFIQFQLAVLGSLVLMILVCWRRHGSMISVLYATPGYFSESQSQTASNTPS